MLKKRAALRGSFAAESFAASRVAWVGFMIFRWLGKGGQPLGATVETERERWLRCVRRASIEEALRCRVLVNETLRGAGNGLDFFEGTCIVVCFRVGGEGGRIEKCALEAKGRRAKRRAVDRGLYIPFISDVSFQ